MDENWVFSFFTLYVNRTVQKLSAVKFLLCLFVCFSNGSIFKAKTPDVFSHKTTSKVITGGSLWKGMIFSISVCTRKTSTNLIQGAEPVDKMASWK